MGPLNEEQAAAESPAALPARAGKPCLVRLRRGMAVTSYPIGDEPITIGRATRPNGLLARC